MLLRSLDAETSSHVFGTRYQEGPVPENNVMLGRVPAKKKKTLKKMDQPSGCSKGLQHINCCEDGTGLSSVANSVRVSQNKFDDSASPIHFEKLWENWLPFLDELLMPQLTDLTIGEMWSQLSKFANVVLHEFSGYGGDVEMGLPSNPEDPQESDMAFRRRTQEDALIQLAYTEQFVEYLKGVIRRKDSELEEKDATLQEEREAAEKKIKKIKLHAKAKVTSLNKQMEEMKAQGGTLLPTEPQSEGPLFKHDKSSTDEGMEVIKLKHQLQEKEELISSLQAELTEAQAEQAAQLAKNSAEVEEFLRMKQQLKEMEELISSLRAQLSQTHAEQAAQNVKVLQRKLEEQENALSARAEVVALLRQELNAAEQRNQVLFRQLEQAEAEQDSLTSTLEQERQASEIRIETMEHEVAEGKLSFQALQEEQRRLLEQLEQVGQARAQLEAANASLERKHLAEMREMTLHVESIQKARQELQFSLDCLKDENSKLRQEKHEQSAQLAQALRQLEDQLEEKSKQLTEFLSKATVQKQEAGSQTSFPDACNEVIQNMKVLQRKLEEQENALSARAEVVDLLRQELGAAEQRNQVLFHQLEQVKAERQASEIRIETMEHEVTEGKLSFQALQEEQHHLVEQLEQVGQARARLEAANASLERKHLAQMREMSLQVESLQKAGQELEFSLDCLKDENSKLRQEKHEQSAQLAQALGQLEDQLEEKSKQLTEFLSKATVQKQEAASQTSFPDASNEVIQLGSMQKVVREKEARFGTQVRLHEDELLQADVDTDAAGVLLRLIGMNMKVLQRKLEEQENALSARAEVVDPLRQELGAAEQRNQVLFHQLEQVKAERQASEIRIETMEHEVAEGKLSFQVLQEEQHRLIEQLEQVGEARARLEAANISLERKHLAKTRETTLHVESLQKAGHELQSSCYTLKDWNAKLRQEKHEQSAQSAEALQQLEDQLEEKSKQLSQFLSKAAGQKQEAASQTSFPDASNEGLQAVTEEHVASLRKRAVELESEKGALLLSSMEFEALKAENAGFLVFSENCSILKEQLRQVSSQMEVLKASVSSFSEAQQQLCNTQQEVSELRKLLEEERDQRVAAEAALSAAKEPIRRLEHREWRSAHTPIIGSGGTQEHMTTVDLTGVSCQRTQTGAAWKRVLRSLCRKRTQLPLLAAIYFFMVHVLLILSFTGHQ